MIGRDWQVTFSDMLTLLLTFFVFMISVSTFKSKEYREFWKKYSDEKVLLKDKMGSFKFNLIEGLSIPMLSPPAEKMLMQLENQFHESDYTGLNVIYNENRIKLILSDDGEMFESGQVILKSDRIKNVLRSMIAELNKTDFFINIQGHTDSDIAKSINNLDLSLKRALSFADFYVQNGLKKDKISVSSYGSLRPIASNNTPEGKAINRRVEVNIIINHSKFK